MFTGLIETTTEIVAHRYQGGRLTLSIARPASFNDCRVGDSIAVNGVCLTIASLDEKVIRFDVIGESLKRANLGVVAEGDRVNVERALTMHQRLGGHFVTGHIDCCGTLRGSTTTREQTTLVVECPEEYRRYIVPKGCIALEGVSLTVGDVDEKGFAVYLIPHTLNNTTLGSKRRGDPLNIEVDLLARYALRPAYQEKAAHAVDMGFLAKHGFV